MSENRTFENIIIKGIGGFYYVKAADGLLECKPKGIFRKKKITPVAGDFVRLEHEAGANIIAEILPRSNVFVRPPVANVDQLFIVVSMVQPVPSTLVVDKLTAIAADKGAQPILVLTKTDLCDPAPFAACYAHSGLRVIEVHAEEGFGVDDVRALLAGKISVFCGNSGVGKSTLLGKLLPNEHLETAAISQKLGRGRHTTREVVFYETSGGLVADTPGFSSLDTERACSIPKENLQFAFPEIARYFGKCRFTGCSHTAEKGCAVLEALKAGEISETRYASYAALYQEAREVADWQR